VANPLLGGTVRIIGKEIVDAKLLMAAPRILEQNRLMVTAMLKEIKPIVVAQTPLGPGHFGYHLRDRYSTDVKSEGIKTSGVLKAVMQGFWREFGTKRGERAFMTAHKAASLVKRFITFYYGGMANWWRA
jgi:hypothetical protein